MNLELLIGLGNPGRKYRQTRHNIGFVILDRLAEIHDIKINKKKFNGKYQLVELFEKKICLVRPENYMNLSGEVVEQFRSYFKADVEDILVIHDDIDLPVGKLRFAFASGHGGHNGIRSMVDWLETNKFHRLKVGVGRPPEVMDPADYVLAKFDKDEGRVVDESVAEALKAIEAFYREGPKVAAQIFNQ